MDRMPEVALMAIGMVAALASFVMSLRVDKSVSDMRAELAEARRQDAADTREWVDNHFQRRLEGTRV
jgi:hypothetical protein